MDTQLHDALRRVEVLPADAITSFRSNGHVLVRGLLSADEVSPFHAALDAAVARYRTEHRPLTERDTYGKAFLQVMNLWEHDHDAAAFVFASRFASAAAQLLGVERVRIYHDQALFKEPGGGPTPWHQDALYWPLDGTRCVTMWMPLVDIDPTMGAMRFADGTNVTGEAGEADISDESDGHFAALIRSRGLRITEPQPMRAGDATFHGGWTIHQALANSSSRMRAVMTVIWFADGLRVQEPANRAQERDLARWLPGLRPGEVAASKLNPAVPA